MTVQETIDQVKQYCQPINPELVKEIVKRVEEIEANKDKPSLPLSFEELLLRAIADRIKRD